MSNQNKQQTEEIDLFYLFKLLGDFINKCFIAAYRLVAFLLKNWILIIGIIILGVILGYFLQDKDLKSPKEATALVRINFNTGSYVYNAVNLLNDKIGNEDTIFLKNANLWKKGPLVKKIAMEPVVDFKNISDNYGTNNRSFELMTEVYDFDSDFTINDALRSDYIFHEISMVLSSEATSETIEATIDYINKNELLKELKEESVAILKYDILSNESTIGKIDTILSNYGSQGDVGNGQTPVVLDNDLTGIIEKKNQLLLTNEVLRTDLVMSKNIAVLINKSNLVSKDPGLSSNKILLYPILLLALFFGWVILRAAFVTAKKLSEKQDANKAG